MFIYDKDMERVMQAKKREIIKELHDEKIRILQELSGVDKLTLTKLREAIADNKRVENNLDTIFNKHNSIINSSGELLEKYEKELEKLIDEAPFDDLKKAMTDFHNVESYGVKANSKESANLNAEIINNLLERGLNVFFPSGKYYVADINITESCTIKGNGEKATTLVYTGENNLFNVLSGGVNISDLTACCEHRDFNTERTGLSVGVFGYDDTGINRFTSVSRFKFENLVFYNFTNSILCDAFYFLEIDNVYTYFDKVGFGVNKRIYECYHGENLIQNVDTTTILCNRLYCAGARRSYEQTGTIGWVIYKTTDVTMNNCISECYGTTAIMKYGVNYNLISPYFEYTNTGIFLEVNLGTLSIHNPYFNACAFDTKVIIEQAGTNIVSVGGRITTDGYTYVNKTTECNTTFIDVPEGVTTPVSSTNGWEWSGVNMFENGRHETRVNSLTGEGYSVVYYGNRTLISPTEIHKYGTEPLYLVHQGTRVARIDESGLAIADSEGNFHTLTVSTTGTLTTK